MREEAETSYAMDTDGEAQFNQTDDNSLVDETLNTSVNCSVKLNKCKLSCMTITTCNASVQTVKTLYFSFSLI